MIPNRKTWVLSGIERTAEGRGSIFGGTKNYVPAQVTDDLIEKNLQTVFDTIVPDLMQLSDGLTGDGLQTGDSLQSDFETIVGDTALEGVDVRGLLEYTRLSKFKSIAESEILNRLRLTPHIIMLCVVLMHAIKYSEESIAFIPDDVLLTNMALETDRSVIYWAVRCLPRIRRLCIELGGAWIHDLPTDGFLSDLKSNESFTAQLLNRHTNLSRQLDMQSH